MRERGQASIEYILMLMVAAMLAVLLSKNFFIPLLNQLGTTLGDQVKSMFSTNLHQIRLGR